MVSELPAFDLIGVATWQAVGDGRFRAVARLYPATVSEKAACAALRMTPEELRALDLTICRPAPETCLFRVEEIRAYQNGGNATRQQ
jgi:hypothetical protein